jgi:DNA-binding helix-hairpin-helix protein with protein kinase domain
VIEVVLESPTGSRTKATLGETVGPVGSQGEVRAIYKVPAAVAKLVRNPAASRLEERLDIMFATRDRSPVTRGRLVRLAWPAGRVRRISDDAVIGYIQPRLGRPQFVPLREMFYDPARLTLLPAATWRWYVALAADLAATVGLVLGGGHLIGDLAPENMFVTASACVAIVDVDGWQLASPGGGDPLPCPFSRPEYTAPEHLDAASGGQLRTPASDWWALAVLIGQILCLGCHPFAGIAAGAGPPFEEAANIRKRSCWLTGTPMSLPAGTPRSAFLPGPLQELFARCFGAGYDEPAQRPSPETWAEALKQTLADLTTCPVRPPSHVYTGSTARCPWCELVRDGGPDRFPGRGSGATGSKGNPTNA